MSTRLRRRTLGFACACMFYLGAGPSLHAEPEDEEDEPPNAQRRLSPEVVFDFDADVVAPAAPSMDMEVSTPGIALGGTRDVDLVRSRLESGMVPEPAILASEGFLAEYDLPLEPAPTCRQKICINTQTVATSLTAEPAVHYLSQIGFGSNIDLSAFRRPPLHAVVVLDLSASMSGAPFEAARAAVTTLGRVLKPGDQMTIVSFGVKPRVLLRKTAMPNEAVVAATVAYVQPGEATALERGLHAGFELARKTEPGSIARVFLVTDDRPTVGRTSAAPFVKIAERGAARGVGLTTIGVGPHFGAPLARTLAGIRGGNSVFLSHPSMAPSRIGDAFESLVTELAYGLEIAIDPAPGMEVSKVYGVPGDMLTHTGDVVTMRVETLFLSKKRGAIFFSLAPRGRANLPRGSTRVGANLGTVRIHYRDLDGSLQTS
ncbi:MAG: vWA domain-containing protein, partial [Nannocystaceae bacterium]